MAHRRAHSEKDLAEQFVAMNGGGVAHSWRDLPDAEVGAGRESIATFMRSRHSEVLEMLRAETEAAGEEYERITRARAERSREEERHRDALNGLVRAHEASLGKLALGVQALDRQRAAAMSEAVSEAAKGDQLSREREALRRSHNAECRRLEAFAAELQLRRRMLDGEMAQSGADSSSWGHADLTAMQGHLSVQIEELTSRRDRVVDGCVAAELELQEIESRQKAAALQLSTTVDEYDNLKVEREWELHAMESKKAKLEREIKALQDFAERTGAQARDGDDNPGSPMASQRNSKPTTPLADAHVMGHSAAEGDAYIVANAFAQRDEATKRVRSLTTELEMYKAQLAKLKAETASAKARARSSSDVSSGRGFDFDEPDPDPVVGGGDRRSIGWSALVGGGVSRLLKRRSGSRRPSIATTVSDRSGGRRGSRDFGDLTSSLKQAATNEEVRLLERELEKVKEELDEAHETIEDLERAAEAKEHELEAARQEADAMAMQVKMSSTALDRNIEARQHAEKEIESVSGVLADTQTAIDLAVQDATSTLRAQIDTLQAQLDERDRSLYKAKRESTDQQQRLRILQAVVEKNASGSAPRSPPKDSEKKPTNSEHSTDDAEESGGDEALDTFEDTAPTPKRPGDAKSAKPVLARSASQRTSIVSSSRKLPANEVAIAEMLLGPQAAEDGATVGSRSTIDNKRLLRGMSKSMKALLRPAWFPEYAKAWSATVISPWESLTGNVPIECLTPSPHADKAVSELDAAEQEHSWET